MGRFLIVLGLLVSLVYFAQALHHSSAPGRTIYRADEIRMSRAVEIAFAAQTTCEVEATDDPVYRTDRRFYCGERYICVEDDYHRFGRCIGCLDHFGSLFVEGLWVCMRIEGDKLVRRGSYEGGLDDDPCRVVAVPDRNDP